MTIRWTIRPDPPVDRDCVLDAFSAVASALAQTSAGSARCVAKGPDRGADVGYHACEETWEADFGSGTLIWTLSPILASMGVSGEFISVHSRGLSVPIRGSALCSARRPGYARLESDDATLQAAFVKGFGAWAKPNAARRLAVAQDQLREELAYRTLQADDLVDAVAELVAQRAGSQQEWLQRLEAMRYPAPHHLAAIASLKCALERLP